MSKRRWQGEEFQANNYHVRGGNNGKSIYLVLDDWNGGFTIRKLDADSPDLSAPPPYRPVSVTYEWQSHGLRRIGQQHHSQQRPMRRNLGL